MPDAEERGTGYQSWPAMLRSRSISCCTWRFSACTDGVLSARHKLCRAVLSMAEFEGIAGGRRALVACGQGGVHVGGFLLGLRVLLKSNSTIANSNFVSLS